MNRRKFLGLIGITATGAFLWPREAIANTPPFPPCGKCLPDKLRVWPPTPIETDAFKGKQLYVPIRYTGVQPGTSEKDFIKAVEKSMDRGFINMNIRNRE